jgi:choline kinase
MAGAVRHVAPAKSMGSSGNLTVVIPAAGMGKRMKSYGPKSLLRVHGGVSILERQIKLVWQLYPKADIIVTVGFEAERIINEIKPIYPVRFVFNKDFETTNVVYSINLALKAAIANQLMLVYGDLVFNDKMIRNLGKGNSKVIVDTKGQMREDEVGVVCNNNNAENFAYSIDTKWCQLAYLNTKELKIFEKVVSDYAHKNWFGYEALNKVLSLGGSFEILEPRQGNIIEVDSIKHASKAMKIG